MNILESLSRIALVTGIFIVWLAMAFLPTLARADGGRHQEKHHEKPPVVVVTPAPTPEPSNDRRLENALLGAAASGLLTTAFRDKQYGALKAIAGTVIAAAAIEAAHSGSFESRNLLWAVGGAAIGSVGVCQLYFRKGFAGCVVPF